jgi:hypothetical protein
MDAVASVTQFAEVQFSSVLGSAYGHSRPVFAFQGNLTLQKRLSQFTLQNRLSQFTLQNRLSQLRSGQNQHHLRMTWILKPLIGGSRP